ncbi:MAG: zinc dependent phospholipase C family protein [Spirochaetota bacterium]
MPSHVSHMLHARDTLAGSDHADRLAPLLEEPNSRFLVLGAQGPDIFYHNQRRRPTGISYGSLMHRRRYGSTVAAMWEHARSRGATLGSWQAAWVLGFASHAVLDRHTHPFINAHSGWPEPGNAESERYRSMHPFLERLIDVELLRYRGLGHPAALDFYSRVSCGKEPPGEWVELMTAALSATYRTAASDAHLEQRLRNAYLDTMGYYRFTNRVDGEYLEAALRREDAGEIGRRWLSVVHPPEVPADLDVLNLEHAPWPHPCSSHEQSTDSFVDRFDAAVREGVAVVNRIVDGWDRPATAGRSAIEHAVANWNLSDGRATERPCRKRHAVPLPLRELQDRIRESVRAGGGGRVR